MLGKVPVYSSVTSLGGEMRCLIMAIYKRYIVYVISIIIVVAYIVAVLN